MTIVPAHLQQCSRLNHAKRLAYIVTISLEKLNPIGLQESKLTSYVLVLHIF